MSVTTTSKRSDSSIGNSASAASAADGSVARVRRRRGKRLVLLRRGEPAAPSPRPPRASAPRSRPRPRCRAPPAPGPARSPETRAPDRRTRRPAPCKIRFPLRRCVRLTGRRSPRRPLSRCDANPVTPPAACASPSSACPAARRRRCCAASTPTGSSSAPTSTASSGGICPMLAAHRNGGRTDVAAFARAWDEYTNPRRPRRATRREVATLRSLLETSLDVDTSLDHVSIAELAAQIRAERRQRAGHVEPGAPTVVPPEPDDASINGPPPRPGTRPAGRHRARAAPARATSASISPGRVKTISGTRQYRDVPQQEAHRLGDVLGPDHLLGRHLALDELGHRRVDEPRAQGGHLDPVVVVLLLRRLAEADHARLGRRVDREPAGARSCRRSRRC